MLRFKVVENSVFAWVASKVLKSKKVAITFGNSVHLTGAGKEEFLANEKWVIHELEHVKQYKKLGFLNFLFQYLWESMKKGYYHNKFEIEAREAAEKENGGSQDNISD
jgi:hypothetical protein